MPHEIMQLDKKKELVLVEATAPILAEKIVYYKNRVFTKRLFPPPEVPEHPICSPPRKVINKRAKKRRPTEPVTEKEIDALMEDYLCEEGEK